MTVFLPALGMIWKTIESYGFDPRQIIPDSLYTPGAVIAPDARMDFDEYNRIAAAAWDLVGDPAAGLRVAEFIHPSYLGALGYSWMASSTLSAGFERLQRFTRMFDELELFSVRQDTRDVTVRVDFRLPVWNPGVVGESQMACLTALCRFNCGQGWSPDRVTLRRAEPAIAERWHAFFRCPVRFGSDADRLVVSVEKANKLLPSGSPELAALHENVIQRYLARLDRDNVEIRARVEIIDQLPSGGVTEASLAGALNLTTRTLHRRLREHGQSFRSLVAEVRKDLALVYLGDAQIRLAEISYLLGYGDTSTMSRAIRRWFGKSPTEMRAEIFGRAE